jgi:cytochrome c biogenesis protein CcmG, thiol:disulfide interchange protein DsbE
MIGRRILYAAPLAVLGAGAAGFYSYMRSGRDPRGVPSALVGRPPPAFDLPPLHEGAARLTNAALVPGRPLLVNFFASWCAPCRIEHPQLMRLAREGVRMLGIAYKDRPEDAKRFLAELGDPFQLVGQDRDGRNAIDWGLYGVPETYFVDPTGIVRWRMAGPITEAYLVGEVRPLLARYAR